MNQVKSSKQGHPKVFLSHSNVDMILARRLRNLLCQRTNIQVSTTEDLSAGEDWGPKLRRVLAGCDAVLALLTPNSVHSNWVLHEVGAAWAMEKLIIPVVSRRDVLNNMPISLESTQVIELPDLESARSTDKFVGAFEDKLAIAHVT